MSAVEPMRLLDERYITSSVALQHSRMTMVVRTDGAGLRDADGRIRLEDIRTAFDRTTRTLPRLRQALRGLPLGLMVPAWVSAEPLDMRLHVALHPGRFPADAVPEAVLSGRLNPPVDPRRPLWDVLVVDLEDGGVLFVCAAHHAMGDGMFGLRMATAVLTSESGMPPMHDAQLPAPPRTAFGLAAGAFTSWYRAQGADPAAAWRDFARKPIRMRMRRMAGRTLRRPRDLAMRLSGEDLRRTPTRESASVELPGSAVRRAARAAGVSVNDLVVAATGLVVDRLGAASTGVLVPIVDRAEMDVAGNKVRVARIQVTGDELPAAAALVREEVQRVAASGEAIVHPAGSWGGFATTLPGPVRPRHLLDATVTGMHFWPNIGLDERFGVFGFSYCGGFTVAAVTDGSISAAALADGVAAELGATVPA